MTRKILRAEVPVDDQWHDIYLDGQIVHVAARVAHSVDVWWLSDSDRGRVCWSFTVVGTGHPLPSVELDCIKTAITPGGALVWHLLGRVTDRS